MRNTTPTLLLSICLLLPAASYASTLDLTTTLTNNYIADGVSTSRNKPALQLGLNYEHDSGFYAGV